MLRPIKINTDLNTIFKQYLTIVNVVLSKEKRLTNIELDVLSKMLYINHLYKHLDKDKRNTIIFHKNTKIKIRESLQNMSDNSFKNVLVNLRKKGFIDYNVLKIDLPLEDNVVDIQFKLKVENNASED